MPRASRLNNLAGALLLSPYGRFCNGSKLAGEVDFHEALAKLPTEMRQAIMLVGAEGQSYEQAAETLNVAVGTIKSRVNRARAKLAELLQFDGTDPGGGRLAAS